MTGILVILACLSADPSKCGKISIITQGCSVAGQAAAVAWLMQHPELRLMRIESCEWGRPA